MTGTLGIPDRLLEDLNATLQEKYPGIEAVRVSRDTLEVRPKPQDDLAAAFPVDAGPFQVQDPVQVPVEKKTAPKRTEDAEDGFGIEPVSDFSGMLTQEQQDRLREIIDGHQDILTRTKPGSGVWHKTCREIARLADGTFGSLHDWNAAWIDRLYRHGTSPRFLSFSQGVPVFDAIDKTLDYIQLRWNEGSGTFWWPKDGVRKSLLEFLVSGSRDGSETSPFIEVYFWHMTWMGYREALPQPARELMDREVRKTDYMGDGLIAMWSGAAQVVQWYENHRDELMRNQSNRSRLANSWDLLRLICDWYAASKFTIHPLRWVRSRTENWNGFKMWAEKAHGVSI